MYTTGEDCRVVAWNVTKGSEFNSWKIGNDKPTCISSLPESNDLIVGSRELKQWLVGTGKEIKLEQTYTGHTSNVNILKSLQIAGDEYILSTSKMDRTIALWRISSKHKNAVATFLMADVAYYVSCSVTGLRLEVAAVTRSGVVHVFIVEDATK